MTILLYFANILSYLHYIIDSFYMIHILVNTVTNMKESHCDLMIIFTIQSQKIENI